MGFASIEDTLALEKEMSWEQRDVAKTLFGLLSETADKFPERPAISYQLLSGPQDKAETLNWRSLQQKTAQAANMFRALGVGPEDVVAFVLPNCNETALTILGGAVAGVVNPINPLLNVDQISSILRETNAKVVVTLKAFPKTDVGQKTAAAVAQAPNVKTVLEIDLNRYLTPPKKWLVPLLRPKNPISHNAEVMDFNEKLSQHATTLTFEDIQKDRVAALFHTGGTTGMPKVAQHTYSGMIYNGWLGGVYSFTVDDNVICPLPLFHVSCLSYNFDVSASFRCTCHFPNPGGVSR